MRNLPPVRVILIAFTLAVWVGVGALMLPTARRADGGANFMESFFTATSAICVTGLVTVDTISYWTPFGQVVILALIQIGGLGVMSLATLIGLSVLGKISLRTRITAASEAKAEGLDDVSGVMGSIVRIAFTIEGVVAAVLALRLRFGYAMSWPDALWHGLFHAVSSFNNAGFALYSDNLMGFVGDPWVCLPIAAAIILGGMGFPVLAQLRRHLGNPLRWSMNTRIVLAITPVLLIAGSIYITAIEWANPATLGGLSWSDRLLAGFFQSVQTRTAGFNSIDIGAMHQASWLGMGVLMFIGGGPAGTAGGIKVTTFAVLFFIIATEVQGDTSVNVFGKRLPRAVHRQALTVALLSVALVVTSTVLLMLVTPYSLDQVLFETASAFGTVGLSTGITPHLNYPAQLLLCFLMYVGRLGPITVASALALRTRKRLYELPQERPIIG